MMTALRSQMKIILWVLVIAFLGTIVFSWGMGGFESSDQAGVIGEINGKEFTYEMFDRLLQYEQQRLTQANEETPDEETIKQIRESLWDDQVDRFLKAEEAKSMNIDVSSREIAYIIENFPPNEIRELEQFQQDGKFEISLYQNFLRDPNALQFLIGMEENVRGYLEEQEMLFHVNQALTVSDKEIRDDFHSSNITAKLRFIPIVFDDFEVDSAEITEEMMKKYYRLFPNRFKKYAQCRFAYVSFKLEPSAADSSDVRQDANDLIADIENGEDFALLAEQFSQDEGSGSKGGDLGWFKSGAMVKPFEEAAFAANPGELVGPVKSKFGLHIIEVIDKRGRGEDLEVNARHILLKYNPSADTRDEVYTQAYNFAQDIKEQPFELIAEQSGFEIDTTKLFSESGYIAGLGRMRMAAEFCFNNAVGSVSEVYPVPSGYVVLKSVEKTEEGIKSFEESRKTINKTLLKLRKKSKAWVRAAELGGKIETLEDMEAVADTKDLRVYVTEDSISPKDKLPDGLKRDKNFLTEAFEFNEGEITEVIEGKNGYYIAYIERKTPYTKEDYSLIHPTIYQSLMNKKQNRLADNWVREMRVAADIQDYRYKYFRDF